MRSSRRSPARVQRPWRPTARAATTSLELEDIRSYTCPRPMQSTTFCASWSPVGFTNEPSARCINVEFGEPVPAFVTLSLGSAFFRTERFAEAEKAYRAALRVDDRLGAAHNNLPVIYLMQERFVEANEHLLAAEQVGFFVNPDLKQDSHFEDGEAVVGPVGSVGTWEPL